MTGKGFAPNTSVALRECGRTSWLVPEEVCNTENAVTVQTGRRGRFVTPFKAEVCPEGAWEKVPTERTCYIGVPQVSLDTVALVPLGEADRHLSLTHGRAAPICCMAAPAAGRRASRGGRLARLGGVIGEKAWRTRSSFNVTGPPGRRPCSRAPHRRVSVADSTISMYLLRNVPVLAGLPDELLEGLAEQLSRVHVQAGRWIMREGEAAESVFIVAQRPRRSGRRAAPRRR